MSALSATKLYTPDLLGLATQLSAYPLTDAHEYRSEVRSKTCGSSIKLGLVLKEDKSIAAVGMQVSACAVGQAAAALFAVDAIGKSGADIERGRDAIKSWLDGEGALPEWQGMAILSPAREHAGRHGAILLPWNAAIEALSNT